jgi:hypothetical protein
MTEIPDRFTFFTSSKLHQRWREGQLAAEWAAAYPAIFDGDDLRIARNQAHLGYHYHEWLSAILLYHTQGLLSLVGKYTFRSHEVKRRLVERLCDAQTTQFLFGRGKESLVQCPDLLVYQPNLTDWFFCEVKGPRDHLRPKQQELFNQVEQVTGKKVYIVKLHETD